MFTPIILAHVVTAAAALVLGGLMLALPKGTPLHRWSGRSWVILMAATALLSFGIHGPDGWSWIHLLSIWTLVTLVGGLHALARGDIARHRSRMRGLYVGLAIAGIFTLLPNRRLGYLLWHTLALA